MYPTNFYIYFFTALIPLVVGFAYYNDRSLGAVWMKVNGFSKEDLAKANKVTTFGLVYVMGLFLSLFLTQLVIHQGSVGAILMPEVMNDKSAEFGDLVSFMQKYGSRYRTFKHGALHGGMTALLLIFPIITINALFEKRGWKYIFIHTGYWFVTCLIMGGILCQTLKFKL